MASVYLMALVQLETANGCTSLRGNTHDFGSLRLYPKMIEPFVRLRMKEIPHTWGPG